MANQKNDEHRQRHFAAWLALGTATAQQVLDAGLRSCITVDPDVADERQAEALSKLLGVPADRIKGRRLSNVAERVLHYARENPQNLARVVALATAMVMLATMVEGGPSLRPPRPRPKQG